MKFKEGDRFIIKPDSRYPSEFFGHKGVISFISKDEIHCLTDLPIHGWQNNNYFICTDPEILEFEEIYNSPLYNVLKEEE